MTKDIRDRDDANGVCCNIDDDPGLIFPLDTQVRVA